MAEWRVAVLGPDEFPDANRRVYRRLKELRDDWPKAVFHVVTATTGAIARAALRAAKNLDMGYTAARAPLEFGPERFIFWWDFTCERTAGQLHHAIVDRKLHTEVYDSDNEPAGEDAALRIQGIE